MDIRPHDPDALLNYYHTKQVELNPQPQTPIPRSHDSDALLNGYHTFKYIYTYVYIYIYIYIPKNHFRKGMDIQLHDPDVLLNYDHT